MSRKHKNPPAKARLIDWMVGVGCLAGFLGIAGFFALKLTSSQKSGPKMIDADGVEYLACGGALWLANEGDTKDPEVASYLVTFKDGE